MIKYNRPHAQLSLFNIVDVKAEKDVHGCMLNEVKAPKANTSNLHVFFFDRITCTFETCYLEKQKSNLIKFKAAH